MQGQTRKTPLKTIAMCILLLVSAATLSDNAKRYQLNIDSQKVEQALRKLANATGSQLLFPYDLVETLESTSIAGRYTLERALEVMLTGTPLSAEFTEEGVILITLNQKKSDQGEVSMFAKRNILTTAIGAVLSGGIVAQEDVSGKEMDGLLEEVIVTAQKRQQRLMDVPISIAVVNNDSLKKASIKNINDLSYLIPNLTVAESESGAKSIVMRGVGNGSGSSPLVGLYLDEIPLAIHPVLAVDVQTIDIQRAEVLRGPQGTLYGQGSIGGTIRLISNKPSFKGFEGEVGVSLSNTKSGDLNEELTGIANIPLIDDKLAVRIAATFKDKSGWIDQPARNVSDANNTELSNLHFKTLWRVSDNVTANAAAIRYRNDSGGFNHTNIGDVTDSIFLPIVRNDLDFPSTDISYDYDIYNLTLSYDWDFATLLSSSTHLDVKNYRASSSSGLVFSPSPGTLIDSVELDLTQTGNAFSQELRLVGKNNKYNWVVGAFYSDVEYSATSNFSRYVGGTGLGAPFDLSIFDTSKSIAFYADLSYLFNDRLTVAVGTRYFEDDRSEIVPVFGTSDRGKFDKLSSRASFSYSLGEQSSVYLSISEGFRSGGFNLLSEQNFDPETVLSYELGAKATLLDGRLKTEAAIFYSQYSDYQDPTVDSQGLYFVGNPGEADIQGVEWSTQFRVSQQLTVGFSANITDAKFTKVAPIEFPTVRVGDPLYLVSKFSYSFIADYSFHWTPTVSGFAHLDYNSQGATSQINRSEVFFYQVDESDDVGFLSAQIGAKWQNFTILLFGRNMNNELRKLNGSIVNNRTQARPRTIGINVSYTF